MSDRLRFVVLGLFSMTALGTIAFLMLDHNEIPASTTASVAPKMGAETIEQPERQSATPSPETNHPAIPSTHGALPLPEDSSTSVAEGASIEGIVVDEDGAFMPDIYVAYGGFLRVSTGPDGRFLLNGLEPGAYVLAPIPKSAGGTNNMRSVVEVTLARNQRVEGLRLVYTREAENTISGRITNWKGEPVAGARVASRCDSSGTGAHMESDEEGRYALDLGPELLCDVFVTHPMYTGVLREAVSTGKSDVDFVLEGRGMVEGQVLDAMTGQPVIAFQVAHARRNAPAVFDAIDVRYAEDEEGKFTLDAVEAGDAWIYARAEGYAPSRVEVGGLGPGKQVTGVVIRLAVGASIDGIVVTPSGAPIAGARVQLLGEGDKFLGAQAWGDGETPESHSSEDGHFTFANLDAGYSSISAEHPEHPATRIPLRLLPKGPTPVRIVMAGPAALEGVVHANGAPLGFQSIEIRSDSGKSRILTESGADGQYQHFDVGEGNISVTATVSHSGFEVSETKTATTRLGFTTTVDFDFSIPPGAVEVTITQGGQPVEIERVTARPADGSLALEDAREASITPEGTYRFTGLFPGIYEVEVVRANGDESLKRHAVEVNVEPGETHSLDIELP